MGQLILSIVFWSVGVFWLLLAITLLRCIVSLRRLPLLQSFPEPPPTVSIIIAARDESARIEKTVRQILAQQGVDLQLIVVNDRSTDATPQILSSLAAELARLKVITIEHLPENWLGKCHAMHVGVQSATGEWLLFSDGDIWLSPDATARTIATAKALSVEHVTLTPRQHVPPNSKPTAIY